MRFISDIKSTKAPKRYFHHLFCVQNLTGLRLETKAPGRFLRRSHVCRIVICFGWCWWHTILIVLKTVLSNILISYSSSQITAVMGSTTRHACVIGQLSGFATNIMLCQSLITKLKEKKITLCLHICLNTSIHFGGNRERCTESWRHFYHFATESTKCRELCCKTRNLPIDSYLSFVLTHWKQLDSDIPV